MYYPLSLPKILKKALTVKETNQGLSWHSGINTDSKNLSPKEIKMAVITNFGVPPRRNANTYAQTTIPLKVEFAGPWW